MVRQPPRDAIKKTLKGRGSALTCKATHLERLNQNKIELKTPLEKRAAVWWTEIQGLGVFLGRGFEPSTSHWAEPIRFQLETLVLRNDESNFCNTLVFSCFSEEAFNLGSLGSNPALSNSFFSNMSVVSISTLLIAQCKIWLPTRSYYSLGVNGCCSGPNRIHQNQVTRWGKNSLASAFRPFLPLFFLT